MLFRQAFFALLLFCPFGAVPQNTAYSSEHSVQGRVYADRNNNAKFDNGDVPLKNVEIIAQCGGSIIHSTSNEWGQYAQPIGAHDCSVRIGFRHKSAIVQPPVWQLADVGAADALQISNIDFRILPKAGVSQDKQLMLTALSPIQAGKTAYLEVKIENGGNFVPKDTLSLNIEDHFDFVQADPEIIFHGKGKLQWEVPALLPYETWSSVVQLWVNPEDGPMTIGSSGVFTATLPSSDEYVHETIGYFIQAEQIENGNNDILANSKSIVGPITLTPDDLQKGATMLYYIRFQNQSEMTVKDVTIIDSLDFRLQGHTFEMVSSSHSYQIFRDDQNHIRWIFKDINLPDSATDIDASQGYVLFQVGVSPNLQPNDFVLNRATLQFDDVRTFRTSPAVFSIRENSGIYEQLTKDPTIEIFPNPTSSHLTIALNGEGRVTELALFDAVGKRLQEHEISSQYQITMDLSEYPLGVYFLHVLHDEGRAVFPVMVD